MAELIVPETVGFNSTITNSTCGTKVSMINYKKT